MRELAILIVKVCEFKLQFFYKGSLLTKCGKLE